MIQRNKLKAVMADRNVSAAELAIAMGIALKTFYTKLNGTSDFYYHEMRILKEYLNLTSEEFHSIFPACS